MSTLYISEIAEKTTRGALGNLIQLMIGVGILYADVLATLMSIPSYTMMCGAIPLIFGCIFIFMPETPVYLMKVGKGEEAQIVLQNLRGDDSDIKNEMKEIEDSLKLQQQDSALKVKYFSKDVFSCCLISFCLHFNTIHQLVVLPHRK